LKSKVFKCSVFLKGLVHKLKAEDIKTKEEQEMFIQHVCLVVKDMDISLAFYRDILGLPVLADMVIPNEFISSEVLDICFAETNAKSRFVALADENGNAVELQQPLSPQVKSTPLEDLRYRTTGIKELAFGVTDLDKAIKNLKEKDVKFRTPVWSVGEGDFSTRSILFDDPDGITLQLVEVK
jgi:catechol 2,3-dioxygenase-like lactoylglutathione lyase family enzyme